MLPEENIQRIMQLYANFQAGQIAPLLQGLDENSIWSIPGPAVIPYTGIFRGHQAVARYLKLLSDNIIFEHLDILDRVGQDDKVVILGTSSLRVKHNDYKFQNNWSHFFTLRNGLVVTFCEYWDTEAGARAFRSHKL